MKYNTKIITIETDGISMDCGIFGEGKEAFVMIPGLSLRKITPASSSIAKKFAGFTSKYTVYVLDRRNNPPVGYSIKDMADDTVKVLESLNVNKADYYGASQGGMIVQQIALSHPDSINKAVLAATASRANPVSRQIIKKWKSLAEDDRFDELTENMTDTVYSESTLFKFRSLLISFNRNLTPEEKAKFLIFVTACDNFDLYNDLANIKCPVFAIGSEGDKVLSVEGTREIIEKTGCSSYIYGKNFGHAVYDEAGDLPAKVLEFLLT